MSVPYLMEDPREAARLVDKVDAPQWVEGHLSEVMSPRAVVLDAGAGPGHLAAAVLTRWPGARVVAFDGSTRRLRVGSMDTTLDRCCGDLRRLPFRTGSFDVAYTRLTLQYVPERGRAVAELARVTRPGGAVVLFDLDGQLVWHDPVDPQLDKWLSETLSALGANVLDPHAGRKLYRLAWEAGLTDLTVRVEPYHLIAGQVDEAERARWTLKLDVARPAITRALGSADRARRAIDAFLRFLDQENTLTYSVAFTVTGRVPG